MLVLDYQLPTNGIEFDIKFKSITEPINSYLDEIVKTAKYVYAKADRPLYVCYSGGIDSEIIIDTMLRSNIPFTAITFRYPNDYNLHDLEYVVKFCKSKALPLQIVDIDPISVYENLLKEGGKILFSWWNYIQIEMLKYIDSIGGCGILGCGLRENPFRTINNIICLNFSSGYFLKNEWCKKNNKLHFPYFYQTRPEVYAAFLKDPLIEHLLTEPNYFVNRNFSPLEINPIMDEFSYALVEKLLISYKFWPYIERRPKYDGLEKIRPVLLELENKFREKNIKSQIITKPILKIKNELGI